MSFRPRRIFIPVLLLVCMQNPGFAQENAAFQQPGLDYRLADDMFRKKNFGSARQLYSEISMDIPLEDPEIATGAAFREAVSAAELDNGDAPAKINRFMETGVAFSARTS